MAEAQAGKRAVACELLYKLAALNLGVPITLFLDNARYQKCAWVTAVAASLNIELCYLPAYSPNLNLVERQFVKKQCLYSQYYADFVAFKTAITGCLSRTHTTYKYGSLVSVDPTSDFGSLGRRLGRSKDPKISAVSPKRPRLKTSEVYGLTKLGSTEYGASRAST